MKKALLALLFALPLAGQAQSITALPQASVPLSGSEAVPIVQGGVTKQTAIGNIPLGSLPQVPGSTLLGNGSGVSTNAYALPIPNCPGSQNALTWANGSGFGCNIIAGGSGGTPGGISGQVQWNNGGSFAGLTITGDATLTANTGSLIVTKSNGTAFGSAAFVGTGTSGTTIPTNSGGFTQSGTANFTGAFQINGTTLSMPPSGTVLASVTGPASNPATGTPSSSTFLRGDGTWAAVSSGSLALISTQTANGTSSSINWTGLSGYNNYELVCNSLSPLVGSDNIGLVLGTGAGPTYIRSNLWNSINVNNSTVAIGSWQTSAQGSNWIGLDGGQAVHYGDIGAAFEIVITGMLGVNGQYPFVSGTGFVIGPSQYYGTTINGVVSSGATQSTAKTAISVATVAGRNFGVGTCSLYGISS